ncbi:MAG: glycosyltransferase [Proteobacteria bacterium]|nr:glycosyltransferase [Pseudomonadota bacterium]
MRGRPLRLLEGSVPYEDYVQALLSADVVVLPYDPQTYRNSASAVFVEALAAGKIVIVPEHSWMAKEAARVGAGHIAFQGHGPEPIAAALRRALTDLAALGAASSKASAAWIAEHDVGRLVAYLCDESGNDHDDR